LRFEANINDEGRVQAATYHAKTLVCKGTSRKLEPQLTLSSKRQNQQPMFVECTCSTLHTLAQQVVAHLPNKSIDKDLRNQVEFTGNRSSLAFQHTVLQKFQSPPDHSSCLDLVEDALTSMIRWHMPAPRKSNANFSQYIHDHFQPLAEQAVDDEFVVAYGRALRRIRKPRNSVGKDHSETSISLPRSISALAMLDLVEEEAEQEARVTPMIKNTTTMDW